MIKRTTIPDLAEAAGVSVSTVNRVINDAASVRAHTRERVLQAAADIGFYGLGSIEHSMRQQRDVHRLGVLLLQKRRPFYSALGEALSRAAANVSDYSIDLDLEFLEDLSPTEVSARLLAMGEKCEAVALVAAEHPLVTDAIDQLTARGVSVAGLITPLNARGNVHYVGIDNWKVGRTAAWAFDKMCREPGKIGILVGNHRYRNQDQNEIGFRSYFREHNNGFTLLEPQSTFESADVAREMTETLFAEHPDMCGLFISGGGITGTLSALRDAKRREGFVTIGYELLDITRKALIDGTLTMVISHPIEQLARQTLHTLIRAKQTGPDGGTHSETLNFEIYTSENV